MPREPVNSPRVGLKHKLHSDPQQYSHPAQQGVTQGASDKSVLWYVFLCKLFAWM